jgi:hypothetical protein
MVLVIAQVVSWYGIREDIDTAAWVALLRANLANATSDALVPCLAVEESLLARTRPELRAAIERALLERRIKLTSYKAPISGSSDCTQVYAWTDVSTPFFGLASVGYFVGDSNGDSVLMVPVLGRWRYVHSWNVWF